MKIFFKCAQRDECGRRVLLGENTGGKAVMLRQLMFQCFDIWLLNGVPYIYIHT
jgi:hypothetical protein